MVKSYLNQLEELTEETEVLFYSSNLDVPIQRKVTTGRGGQITTFQAVSRKQALNLKPILQEIIYKEKHVHRSFTYGICIILHFKQSFRQKHIKQSLSKLTVLLPARLAEMSPLLSQSALISSSLRFLIPYSYFPQFKYQPATQIYKSLELIIKKPLPFLLFEYLRLSHKYSSQHSPTSSCTGVIQQVASRIQDQDVLTNAT